MQCASLLLIATGYFHFYDRATGYFHFVAYVATGYFHFVASYCYGLLSLRHLCYGYYPTELPKPLSTAHVGILHVNKTTPYELLGGKTSLPDANAKKAKAFVTTLLTQYARNEFQLAPNEKDMQVSTSPLRYDSPMMKQIMRTQTTMEFGSVTQAEIDRQNGFRNNRFIPILAIVLTVNNTNSKESMQATIFGISRCSASLTTYSIVINQVIYGSNVYYGDLSAYSY